MEDITLDTTENSIDSKKPGNSDNLDPFEEAEQSTKIQILSLIVHQDIFQQKSY